MLVNLVSTQHNKVNQIRALRKVTALSLLDAKNAVENLRVSNTTIKIDVICPRNDSEWSEFTRHFTVVKDSRNQAKPGFDFYAEIKAVMIKAIEADDLNSASRLLGLIL